ncbi:hypothetical protein BGZ96_001757 [Linnemannia gamsii]|uniref:Uncharacterized protein n=1 Tax=Linnemannia gamsii TaxID=64522 RepID=A0ABQ7JLR1_9FUNG|nr:hypothetical protein BGZ96_001757 [Linnemannia gamsii]
MLYETVRARALLNPDYTWPDDSTIYIQPTHNTPQKFFREVREDNFEIVLENAWRAEGRRLTKLAEVEGWMISDRGDCKIETKSIGPFDSELMGRFLSCKWSYVVYKRHSTYPDIDLHELDDLDGDDDTPMPESDMEDVYHADME